MFERSLSQLIKGLRANAAAPGSGRTSHDERRYVSQILDEIRYELNSDDLNVKGEALLKLTYLQMLGHAAKASAYSFKMLEVMSSPKLHLKHVGYLAACQCFTPQTDVLILATNLVQKDLHSRDPLEVAIALNGLSHLATPELVPHLTPDLIALLSSTNPSTRKKAILALHALIEQDTQALDASWEVLSGALNDSNAGVVGAAVNVICELARKDAARFLPLGATLLRLLSKSTNNWTLIKLLKLFGYLAPHDEALARQLRAPLNTIVCNTPAVSLAYEAANTAIVGGLLDAPADAAEREFRDACLKKLENIQKGDANLRCMAKGALDRLDERGHRPHSHKQKEANLLDFGDEEDVQAEQAHAAPASKPAQKQKQQQQVQTKQSDTAALVDIFGEEEPKKPVVKERPAGASLLDDEDPEQLAFASLHTGR